MKIIVDKPDRILDMQNLPRKPWRCTDTSCLICFGYAAHVTPPFKAVRVTAHVTPAVSTNVTSGGLSTWGTAARRLEAFFSWQASL